MIFLHTLSTPENYNKAEWYKTKKIASNHFISFFLIYQQCKIYVKWVLIYSLQSEKKNCKITRNLSHKEGILLLCDQKKYDEIYWWKVTFQ